MTGLEIAALATGAVTFLASEGAKEIAKKSTGVLWHKLGGLIKSKPNVAEAHKDLIESAGDPDAQAALRLKLRKAIEEDSAYGDELRAVLRDLETVIPEVRQLSIAIGDGNTNIQISGSGNQVST